MGKIKNLFAERDEAGNVLIRKPATAGMEIAKLSPYKLT
ncbi:aminoacyl-histidine dipeptidase [Actinobacillus equuli]|nr:aminoacyl-histidine dipeptidase [Actinobacillus equuli]